MRSTRDSMSSVTVLESVSVRAGVGLPMCSAMPLAARVRNGAIRVSQRAGIAPVSERPATSPSAIRMGAATLARPAANSWSSYASPCRDLTCASSRCSAGRPAIVAGVRLGRGS